MRCKIEFASVAWNSVTLTDSHKVESFRMKISGFSTIDCFINIGTNNYDDIFLSLNLSKLQSIERQLDDLFLINFLNNKISWNSILNTICLRVTTQHLMICTVLYCTVLYCIVRASHSIPYVTKANILSRLTDMYQNDVSLLIIICSF
jgi:hypothetical protein